MKINANLVRRGDFLPFIGRVEMVHVLPSREVIISGSREMQCYPHNYSLILTYRAPSPFARMMHEITGK